MAAIGTGWVDGAWTEAGWVAGAWVGGAAAAAEDNVEDRFRTAKDFVQTANTFIRATPRITKTIVRGYD